MVPILDLAVSIPSKRYFTIEPPGDLGFDLGRLYGRAKRRPVNLTTKQSPELNSVGSETSKSMKFFWFGPLPVMTSSPLIRLQRPLPLSGGAISINENITL